MAPKTRSKLVSNTNASQSANADPPALPILPPEIVLHIIRLSLPLSTYAGFKERSATLRTLSLVSPLWRALAQSELFKHPVVTTHTACIQLLQTLATMRGKECRKYVKSLSVESVTSSWMHGTTDFRLSELVKMLPGIERMWLADMESVMFDEIAAGPNLRELYCLAVTFSAPIGVNRRKLRTNLVRLSLGGCDIPSGTILPSSLPRLAELSMYEGLLSNERDLVGYPADAAYETIFAGVASQLSAFHVDQDMIGSVQHQLHACTSLTTLSLPWYDDKKTRHLLQSLPRPLQNLHVQYHDFGSDPFPPPGHSYWNPLSGNLSRFLQEIPSSSVALLKRFRIPHVHQYWFEVPGIKGEQLSITMAMEQRQPPLEIEHDACSYEVEERRGMEASYDGVWWDFVDDLNKC